MSEVMKRLLVVRGLAWAGLIPAIDHAIAMAREAEYVADHASNMVQAGISPAYPPLVQLLAEAAGGESRG